MIDFCKKMIKNKHFMMCVAFLICFLPRLYYSLHVCSLRVVSDEFNTLYSAARLAGYNWDNIASEGSYYGYGFYSLFFWVYKLLDDPVQIYMVISIFLSILQAGISIICFYICDRYMEINDIFVTTLISIVCSYSVVTRTTTIFNEHPLILTSWLVALLFCKIISEKKPVYYIALYAVLFFSLTFHTRAALLFVITTCVLFLSSFIMKDKILKLRWIVIAVVLFACAKGLTKWYQYSIWNTNEITNASVSIKTVNGVFDIYTVKAWLNIVLGQIETIDVFFFGMATLFLIVIFYNIFRICKNKLLTTDNYSKIIFIISVTFLLCAGGTIFAQSLSWLSSAAEGVKTGTFTYGCKSFSYIRYFSIYIGPLVMCGLVFLAKSKNNRIFVVINLCLMLLLALYWHSNILPIIRNVSTPFEPFFTFSGSPAGELTYVSGYEYTHAVSLSFKIALICMALLVFNKNRMFLIVCCAALIYQYSYAAMNYDIAQQKVYYSRIDATYSYLCSIEDSIDSSYLDTIYVYDKRSSHQTFFQYQFHMPHTNIEIGIPDESYNGFILSNTVINDKLSGTFRGTKLDSGEYIYFYGDSFIDYIDSLETSIIP